MANLAVSGPVWSFTTPAAAGGPLPSGWSHRDIGSVGPAGNATFTSGTFTVAGGGADIWGTADALHYASQSMTGDGQLIARVATISSGAAWIKAGVMIRATTASNSAMAIMLVSKSKGTAFQYRTSNGGATASIAGPGSTAPYYVKIVRAGSTVTGFTSSNGSTWTQVGSATIALGSTVQIGLAVSSHDSTTHETATFDGVAR
jgi:hypothetical protein